MIICADDFGIAPDVNEAILDLAQRKRISAVSCMAVLPQCSREVMSPLLDLGDSLDLGLHFKMPGPSPAAQYRMFVGKTGRAPDFIDGHFHVHQWPVIRKMILNFVANLPADHRPYVRNTYLPMRKILKQGVSVFKNMFISFRANSFRRLLQTKGIATNEGFAGIYDYRLYRNYPKYFQIFLEHMESDNGILMVHPGSREAWQKSEYETLAHFQPPQGLIHRFKKYVRR